MVYCCRYLQYCGEISNRRVKMPQIIAVARGVIVTRVEDMMTFHGEYLILHLGHPTTSFHIYGITDGVGDLFTPSFAFMGPMVVVSRSGLLHIMSCFLATRRTLATVVSNFTAGRRRWCPTLPWDGDLVSNFTVGRRWGCPLYRAPARHTCG